MDPDSCAFWLDAIALAAALLWLAGAIFLGCSAHVMGSAAVGATELPGSPAEVTRQTAAALSGARAGGPLAAVVLDAVDDEQIAWHTGTGLKHRGRLWATPGGPGTRVVWEVHTTNTLLTVGRWVSALALLVIAGLYWALQTYALPSPHAAVRGQVLQMLQAIHVLWPPFLFGVLAIVLRRRLLAEIERVIGNQRFARSPGQKNAQQPTNS